MSKRVTYATRLKNTLNMLIMICLAHFVIAFNHSMSFDRRAFRECLAEEELNSKNMANRRN